MDLDNLEINIWPYGVAIPHFVGRGVDSVVCLAGPCNNNSMMQDTHHAPRAPAVALETGLPVWLGVGARYRDDKSNRLVGFDYPEVDFADSLAALIPMGSDVVNVMHTEVAAVAPAIDRVRERWQGPVGVYPEVPYVVSPTWRTEVSPARLVAEAKTWVGQGARLIGGCCGTTPEHIAALAVWLRSGAG